MNRRKFINAMTAAGAAATLGLGAKSNAGQSGYTFNCFTKLLQWLDYDQAAEVLKSAGYDGADLTVRPGGHVLPERVEEDLPRAVEAFHKVGLKVPMMVTKITRPDDPYAETTLRTARSLGIRIYRLGYLRYDDNIGVEKSIESLRPQMAELADLNRQLCISGAYQNHAGTRVGSTVWDLFLLLKGINPKHLGIQYDIKHATAEGGHSWIVGLKLVARQISCLVLKDFLWQKQTNGGWKDETVPLASGMVDYHSFFKAVKKLGLVCPISVHIEYKTPHMLEKNAAHAEVKQKEVEVYRRDLFAAKTLMKKSGLI